MLEEDLGGARVVREGDGGEVEEPTHGEGLEGKAEAEHVAGEALNCCAPPPHRSRRTRCRKPPPPRR